MRTTVVSSGLAALLLAVAALPLPLPLAGQGLLTDARRAGMGGVSLTLDGALTRYNPAYRAVPPQAVHGGAKATIPIPLGLIQFFHDHPISNLSKDPLFHPDSTRFNPIELMDLVLHLPLFYDVRKVPTPTNDVTFGIGRDSFQVDLGKAQSLIPADQFGIAGSSRPLSIGPTFHGVSVGVTGWLHNDVEFQLDDSLLAFLKDAHEAHDNTTYSVFGNVLVEGGFAPSIGYSGRLYGKEDRGLYVGGGVHYYLGVAYGSSRVDTAGFKTGSPIFTGTNPVTPQFAATTSYSKYGNTFGHGVGVDVGLAWVTGPIVFGVGVNDIGATITWPDTRIEHVIYDNSTNKFVNNLPPQLGVETKTKLPVTYLANVIYTLGGTTVGADVLDNGRGTQIHVGAEQRFGPFALRGGVARDQRKKVEFGWGGGLRFGPFGLDAGFWTHSNALSDQRGITMATSLSIY